jgi:hypothetical protein
MMRKVWMAATCSTLLAAELPAAHDDWSLNKRWALTGDFVYMRRTDVHDHTLINDSSKSQCNPACPDFSVCDTHHLVRDFDFEPGYRLALTYLRNKKTTYELSYLWLHEWTGSCSKHGVRALSFPFTPSSYAQDFQGADAAHAEYVSHFWSVEANYWRHMTPRRVDYFSLSWLLGLRYMDLHESFELAFHKGANKSDYDIHTKNHLFGVQAGLDLQMNPTRRLSWELSAKVGALADWAKQDTFLGDQNNTRVLRDYDATQWHATFLADCFASVAYQCTSYLNVHLGYQMIYLTGLALAPEQIDKDADAHKRIYLKGEALIYGLFGGLTFGF